MVDYLMKLYNGDGTVVEWFYEGDHDFYRILKVPRGSFIQKAGLRAGDIISLVDGKPIDGWGLLEKAAKKQNLFKVTFKRGSRNLSFQVNLVGGPAEYGD